MIIWLIVAGLASGIIAGMGMGGGTILIPVLTLLCGVEQKLAQSINLLVFIPTAIIALIIHFKNKLVVWKVGLIIISSGLLFSVLGALLATNLTNNSLRLYFGIFLLFVGVWQLIDAVYQMIVKKNLSKYAIIKTKYTQFNLVKK